MGLRAKFLPVGSGTGVWQASKGQEVKGKHWAEGKSSYLQGTTAAGTISDSS